MLPKSISTTRVFGTLALLVAAVELVLCFVGPIAFVQKPSLMLFPPLSSSLSEEQLEASAEFIERQIALTKSFSIVSHDFIEEYFIRTDPEYDRSKLEPVDYKEAQTIAQELELERFAMAWIYCSSSRCDMTVSIRDASDGNIIRSGSYSSDTLEKLLQGIGEDGEPIDFKENLALETRGIGFTDMLILALLALQFSVAAFALLGREPGILVEMVWAPALILFLFAYIYALSANMDYVQRYIASQGQLKLAESTTKEQLFALLRHGPVLALYLCYYIRRNLTRRPAGADRKKESWLTRIVTRWSLPWVVLSAVLFSLCFPSAASLEGFGWLAWFCLAPLFLVLLTNKPGTAIFYGVVFGTLQALIINYWHGTYDYVTLHLITIAFVVEYTFFMFCLVGLIRATGKWGVLAVPAAWAFFDYVRSIGVIGYPWGLIGTSQYRFLPFIQIASITGVWGLNFIVLLSNAAIAWTAAAPMFEWSWPRLRKPATTLFPVIAFAALFAVCLLTGGIILSRVQSRLYSNPDTPTATVLLLQQNTDPRKHEYKKNFEKIMSLTDEAISTLPRKPDLIVWPEGGFKLDIRYWGVEEKKNSYWGKVVRSFRSYQNGLGTWLLTGTQDHEMVIGADGEKTRRNFNSSLLLEPDGRINAFYHKIHLVPFSEYFPLDKEQFKGLYELFKKYDISNWGLGETRLVYQHEKMRFNTPICFEDVFSDHVRRFVLQDADMIINMSNDYWSLTPVEGRQHGILALFRTVENHRPLLRSTSSGYTVYIDAVGRIQPGSPEPYTAGYTVATVPIPEKHLTLYTRWGDWFPLVCILLMLVPLGFRLLTLLKTSQLRQSRIYTETVKKVVRQAP